MHGASPAGHRAVSAFAQAPESGNPDPLMRLRPCPCYCLFRPARARGWKDGWMRLVERLAEAVARSTTRRGAMKGLAAAAFAYLAALAASGGEVDAARCAVRLTEDTACNMPFLTACADTDPALCQGTACIGACTPDTIFYGQQIEASCWCTALERQGTSRNRYAYWKCCDCRCTTPIVLSAGSPWPSTQYPDGTYGCGCRERVSVRFDAVGKRPRPGRG